MSQLAIKAENISKQYRLGKVGTGTLSHDLNRLWYKVRGLEDPYVKIGEANDRSIKGESDYVWSLRDINFEIEQGDSVGIIGRNGAGKSTLLKLLSKVTKPTTGGFKVNGRIASLLEVGTGFNPEMSGRENIYLNGAILGMRRAEITRKLDEIISFSGVERYIDTPVKRYSSGMYVRLAFAVAAHLESEILIVDEVLAVGDAEFQKKCLGKMNDVSEGEGRTVLFVSHNMGAVKQLCGKGILLNEGKIIYKGEINEVIKNYTHLYSFKNENRFINPNPKETDILSASLQSDFDNVFFVEEKFKLKLEYRLDEDYKDCIVNFIISNHEQDLFMSFDTDLNPLSLRPRSKGVYQTEIEVPEYTLKQGHYFISIGIGIVSRFAICQHAEALSMEVISKSKNYSFVSYREGRHGVAPLMLPWKSTIF